MKNSKLPVIILLIVLVVSVIGFGIMYSKQSSMISNLEEERDNLKTDVETLTFNLSEKEAMIVKLTADKEALEIKVTDLEKNLNDSEVALTIAETSLDSELARQKRWADYIEPSNILGEWTVVQLVDKEDDFDPSNNSVDAHWLKSMKFMDEKASFDMGEGYQGTFPWADDHLLLDTAMGFMIKEVEGTAYLFLEWKSGDYIRDNTISYYVFKK